MAVGAALALLGGGSAVAADWPEPDEPPAALARRTVEATRDPLPQATAAPTATPIAARAVPKEPAATPKREVGVASNPGRPERISVPRLGVSAPVLGIRAKNGALIPPSNPRTVGWWSDGARPGAARGSAIITGHTVHSGGGAFDDLDRLVAGDRVKVTTVNGAISYTVVAVTTYRKQALAKHAAQVFDQSTPGRLVLVTCEDWNGSVYLSNAVVIAKPLS
jgi:LPXTG-site transpeptidase (sortase) family protein